MPEASHTNNKRIAKNTLMLYVRMLLTTGVILYTSRIVLRELGDVDFGIYNIVAGVVVLFTFVNSAMSTAVQRFINYALGQGDELKARRVFSSAVNIHLGLVILLIILAETVGLWFLNYKLNIPADKIEVANVVYHLSVVTTCINIMIIPYNASIIANEKMSFFAYISIVEVIMKLIIAFMLTQFLSGKLLIYASLILVVALITLMLNYFFCKRKFAICSYFFVRDKSIYGQLLSFSGWSLLGSSANMGASQGANILLNMFYGVTMNAALGIANQVNVAVTAFVTNFQTAFRPQLVKSYSAGDMLYLRELVRSTAKMSFILLFAIAYPLYLNLDYVLGLWLVDVPSNTAIFIKLILVSSLIETFSGPLWMLVQARGKIRNYQIIISSLIFSNVLFSYIFLALGYAAEVVFVVKIVLSVTYLAVRLIFLNRILGEGVFTFCYKVIFLSLAVSFTSAALIYLLSCEFEGFIKLIVSTSSFLVLYAVLCYFFILGKELKEVINKYLRKLSLRHG